MPDSNKRLRTLHSVLCIVNRRLFKARARTPHTLNHAISRALKTALSFTDDNHYRYYYPNNHHYITGRAPVHSRGLLSRSPRPIAVLSDLVVPDGQRWGSRSRPIHFPEGNSHSSIDLTVVPALGVNIILLSKGISLPVVCYSCLGVRS